jgi:hypothetical protein
VSLSCSYSQPFVHYYGQSILDPSGNGNGRLDAGETADLVVQLKNFGTATVDVSAQIQSSDPYLTIHAGTSGYGNIGAGLVADNAASPFSIEVASYTPEGHIAPVTLTATFAGGQTVSNFGLVIGKWGYLVWDPTPDQSSGPAIHTALRSLGYTGALTGQLPVSDLDAFQAVFVSLGIFANNYVVNAGSAEALALVAFMQQGGCAYLEGGDVWYYDPTIGGHDFCSYFGLQAVSDGAGDMSRAVGVPGTFTAEMSLSYGGENSFIDHLSPIGTGFTVFNNFSPGYICGVANETATHRTVGCSFEFGGLTDGAWPSTKVALAQAIMEFFMPIDPQAIGENVHQTGLTFLAPAEPNPCPGLAILRYGLGQSAPVHIGLYDASGRCVRILAAQTQPAGAHALELDTRGLASGLYFIRSELGDRILANKFVVTR